MPPWESWPCREVEQKVQNVARSVADHGRCQPPRRGSPLRIDRSASRSSFCVNHHPALRIERRVREKIGRPVRLTWLGVQSNHGERRAPRPETDAASRGHVATCDAMRALDERLASTDSAESGPTGARIGSPSASRKRTALCSHLGCDRAPKTKGDANANTLRLTARPPPASRLHLRTARGNVLDTPNSRFSRR